MSSDQEWATDYNLDALIAKLQVIERAAEEAHKSINYQSSGAQTQKGNKRPDMVRRTLGLRLAEAWFEVTGRNISPSENTPFAHYIDAANALLPIVEGTYNGQPKSLRSFVRSCANDARANWPEWPIWEAQI